MDPDKLEQMNNAGSSSLIPGLISLVLIALMLAALWKVFVKAGEPGWAAVVPIYNVVVLLKIAGKPVWWIILLLIPFVNLIVGILVALGLSERFGKGGGFGVGLALLPIVFYPILGFGGAAYVGSKTV